MNTRRGARLPKAGPRHTHFIGIELPSALAESVEDCRSWMEGSYGCRSGHGTPPHITLLPPFALPPGYGDGDVADCCAAAVRQAAEKGLLPLAVRVEGFGSFSERTLFAHVVDGEGWQQLYAEFVRVFQEGLPGALKKPGRRFYPHISIANRDIPAGAMEEALRHFAQLGLEDGFEADSVTVFTRTRDGGWTASGQQGL